jgi:hypothetical protein
MEHERFRFRPTNDLIAAVAISRIPGDDGGTHSGIIYRDSSGALSTIHQGWFERTSYDNFDGDYGFAVPDIDEFRLDQVAGLCRLIRANGTRIPYAFRLDLNAQFCTRTGSLLTLGESIGLTCSHFVIVVFQSIGIQLVDLVDWPVRAGDIAKQRVYLQWLNRTRGVTPAFIARAESEIGNHPRVRSEEVAGACLERSDGDIIAATHKKCEPNGLWILRVIEWLSKLHPWIQKR